MESSISEELTQVSQGGHCDDGMKVALKGEAFKSVILKDLGIEATY